MALNFRKRVVAGLELIEVPGDPTGPYIMLFHGFGADNTDLVSLSHFFQASPKPTWIFPNAPYEVNIGGGFMGKAWFPIDMARIQSAVNQRKFNEISKGFPSELAGIRMRVNDLIAELQIPWSKLILGGFSQGSILAMDIAFHAPERIAALLIFSGIAIDQENWKKIIPLHAGLPFFQSHGEFDPLLPFECALDLESILIKGGLHGKLHRFHGGHEIPQQTLSAMNGFLSKLMHE